MSNENKYYINLEDKIPTRQCKFAFDNSDEDDEYLDSIVESGKSIMYLYDCETGNSYIKSSGDVTPKDMVQSYKNLLSPIGLVYSAGRPNDADAVAKLRQEMQDIVDDDSNWNMIQMSIDENSK